MDDPSIDPIPDPMTQAKEAYAVGKAAFERGRYREAIVDLEASLGVINPNSRLGSEIQMVLIMAYEAAGQREEARNLCRAMERHPDPSTRKQASRILYILEAPQLNTRPEWVVQIPDLTTMSESNPQFQRGQGSTPAASSPKPRSSPYIEDLGDKRITTPDNAFIWVALGAIVVVLAGLFWWF
jgi:tetratricopeptide (TPR) repeat protein